MCLSPGGTAGKIYMRPGLPKRPSSRQRFPQQKPGTNSVFSSRRKSITICQNMCKHTLFQRGSSLQSISIGMVPLVPFHPTVCLPRPPSYRPRLSWRRGIADTGFLNPVLWLKRRGLTAKISSKLTVTTFDLDSERDGLPLGSTPTRVHTNQKIVIC